jgi:uncharacterized protein with HEPN domain
MQRDPQYLLDILQSAKLIQTYLRNCDRQQFINDIQLQDSVIRRLLIIAEAARRLSDSTRQNFPQIEWQEINGMRNRLVHEYENIDLNIVWDVIQIEIPDLIEQLKHHIPPQI